MTITCKLSDIKTNDMIWKLIGSDRVHTEQIEFKPYDLSEGLKAFEHERLFEYNFKIIIPELKLFFRLGYWKEVGYPRWKLIGDFLHVYEIGSEKPCGIFTRGDMYSNIKDIVHCFFNNKPNVNNLECIIEVPDAPENLYHCTLFEANHILFDILHPNICPIEMIKTGEWPDCEFYDFNLTVEVPSLGIYFKRHTHRSLKPDVLKTDDAFSLIEDYTMYSSKTHERIAGETDLGMQELIPYVDPYMSEKEIDQLECYIRSPYPAEIFDQFLPDEDEYDYDYEDDDED